MQAAPHVGHARSAIAFDVLHRWLIASGYDVHFLRNVTDIDDKILHDAAHAGSPWWAHATYYYRLFSAAYDALNAATEGIETEQTKRVPEHLKNKHFPVNPER